MRKSRFSEQQIALALQQAAALKLAQGLKRKLPGAGTAMRQQEPPGRRARKAHACCAGMVLAPSRPSIVLHVCGGWYDDSHTPRLSARRVQHESGFQTQEQRRRCGTQSKGARGEKCTPPERPGSLQYHAPSCAGHHQGEGTGVLARLLPRAEPYPQ